MPTGSGASSAWWGAGTIVVHGEVIEAIGLPALIAENGQEP
jgi:hypothetical protein